jgi:hypothetical protein
MHRDSNNELEMKFYSERIYTDYPTGKWAIHDLFQICPFFNSSYSRSSSYSSLPFGSPLRTNIATVEPFLDLTTFKVPLIPESTKKKMN